jgi:hypothetical protein
MGAPESEERRLDLCFVHVPKTAGLSWLDMIVQSLGERDFVERGVNHTIHRFASRDDLQLTRLGHETRVPGCLTLGQYRRERVGPSFVIAFVRNPYDRLVSAFHFLNRTDLPPRDRSDRARYVAEYEGNFRRFVQERFAGDRPEVLEQIHFRPQHEWLVDDRGELATDFVGRYESLERDTSTIAERVGFVALPLTRSNTSEHEPFPHYYDEPTRALVARAYRNDFELFGYDPERLD